MEATTAVIFVFLGCCSNVIFLELLIKDEPGCGSIITCSQFIFISVQGFIFTADFGRKKNVIPLKEYLVLVVMFFIVNVINNLVFSFNISMPLHVIFRSGGLIANLLMGMVLLGRTYSLLKCFSVTVITLGTILCTIASADVLKEEEKGEMPAFTTWLVGIALLILAQFLSAYMGIYHECLYLRHGKHPHEGLYYIHLLSLPGFVLTSPGILEHVGRFNASTPLPSLAYMPLLAHLPKLWLFLLGNTLTQYMCISSVFQLTTECTALTVTLVLTLRKFLSLLVSIIYFQNPFTFYHWAGTFLVFSGTLLFSDVYGKVQQALRGTEPEGGAVDEKVKV